MASFAGLRSEEGAVVKTPLSNSPVVDSGSCQLLGTTALIVQGLMGILVLSSLVFKRYREKPRRPWRIWLFDVSKQVVGQMFVHGVNVLISGVISELTDRNACVFYFLNIGIDTTLGVGIIYGCLHGLNYVFSEKLGWKGFESGVYGGPPSINYWCRQAATYLTSLLVMKAVVIGMFILIPGIFTAGEWLLSWTHVGNSDTLQVVFVMGIFPIAMNIMQFWLIDSIVKASSPEPSVALGLDTGDPFDHADREPLFNASDDEDDDTPHRPRDVENQISPHPSQSTFAPSSYMTGSTTPDGDESKSIKEITKPSSVHSTHSYPPSLSSSQGSTSDRSSIRTKEPKNLLKQASRRKVSPAAAQVTKDPTTSDHSTTFQVGEPARKADDWEVSWDDDGADSWDEATKPQNVKAQEHDRDTGVVSTSTIPLNRPRRLS